MIEEAPENLRSSLFKDKSDIRKFYPLDKEEVERTNRFWKHFFKFLGIFLMILVLFALFGEDSDWRNNLSYGYTLISLPCVLHAIYRAARHDAH